MNIQVKPSDIIKEYPVTTRLLEPRKVAVAFGDGIGPEIMKASLRVLQAAGAQLDIVPIEVGEKVYFSGNTSGIPAEAWDVIRDAGLIYKAPITTPQGGGYKSLNVTMRKSLGLFANVRPCASHAPFVTTKHPDMNVVIVRENEEDLYAGIEHRQTDDVYQCLKLVSRPGCEKIVRYAFEYARTNGRKKVSCFSKDNIMKMTDGLFHKVFDEIAQEYPDIQNDHWIIDIGAAMLADKPELFDVIVSPNLYGDIVSDITSQISGSVGLGPSANIGEHVAMFEAIHGSAPALAGMDEANPSGLLLAGVMMLEHIGQQDIAVKVHNAWLRTIEEGIHTADIYDPVTSTEKVGTQAFANAVIDRLGQTPVTLMPAKANPGAGAIKLPAPKPRPVAEKTLVGVDVFFHARTDADELAERLQAASHDFDLELRMISNRGVKVWPQAFPETYCTDHWRCRYEVEKGARLGPDAIIALLTELAADGIEVVKTENLYLFDGERGYSLGQGQ